MLPAPGGARRAAGGGTPETRSRGEVSRGTPGRLPGGPFHVEHGGRWVPFPGPDGPEKPRRMSPPAGLRGPPRPDRDGDADRAEREVPGNGAAEGSTWNTGARDGPPPPREEGSGRSTWNAGG